MKKCLTCNTEINDAIRSTKKFCVVCRAERDKRDKKKYIEKYPERRLNSATTYREKNRELCIKRSRISVLKKHDEYKAKSLKHHKEKYFGGLRDAVVARDGNKCRLCNSSVLLAVHHIDTDKTNNTLSNLISLCAHCHSTWHCLYWHHKNKRKDMINEMQKLNEEPIIKE